MIELTSNRRKISIDPTQIESVRDLNTYGNRETQTVIITKSGKEVAIGESYNEVMRLISDFCDPCKNFT